VDPPETRVNFSVISSIDAPMFPPSDVAMPLSASSPKSSLPESSTRRSE
jgi:hypothetical protein